MLCLALCCGVCALRRSCFIHFYFIHFVVPVPLLLNSNSATNLPGLVRLQTDYFVLPALNDFPLIRVSPTTKLPLRYCQNAYCVRCACFNILFNNNRPPTKLPFRSHRWSFNSSCAAMVLAGSQDCTRI